jgi:hypothetical protein
MLLFNNYLISCTLTWYRFVMQALPTCTYASKQKVVFWTCKYETINAIYRHVLNAGKCVSTIMQLSNHNANNRPWNKSELLSQTISSQAWFNNNDEPTEHNRYKRSVLGVSNINNRNIDILSKNGGFKWYIDWRAIVYVVTSFCTCHYDYQ